MDGILPLWKDRGMTSHDCVSKLRKILHTKKIGHSGTLDPDVDGVLPICIGKGTKVVEFLVDSGKEYEGEITLGYATTTEDASGEVVQQDPINEPFSVKEIDDAMQKFVGEMTQVPPLYSAVKVNGKRLYEYARSGQSVERPQRKVQIESFTRTSRPVHQEKQQTQSWRFKVVCGKGVYVRTLAVDLGKELGVSAHMSDLTRVKSAGFTKGQAITLEKVQAAAEKDQVSEILLPIEYGVQAFQRVDISEQLWQKVRNGARLPYSAFGLVDMPKEAVAIFYQNQVVSLYEANKNEKNGLKPLKVLKN
ncbi:tRNA pseudouridine(55) synthase TruB [Tetragenococcus halophilus]|uniref:tRNA pseudouridine synthase B n=1 Tax=Tetragenococcus halophilus (strain DSM 20338 / JCM 20259 / NCIMB 9735 / NBRC 12172) TaxID=945021 RepID=A0AAN1SHJ9_TETHN|nr:tRNA pseudouridine(55) synthase TruB [Tetragenococcus halophilus]MCO7025506.1 tRNA pseudouridine(55) synthase TruB [Tetragenococcus halophilus]NWN99559.1 tRNA pseudouridine(55) synthase TruB [Tetragenococcus halophilus]QXN85952.1 tRNA pseudouridine(55) synthase TruB [Tetragenococcus halophilus]RQD32677.1 tRNA pseudouridine(55) synthase TruB [Tetragenococcus halophilus subsp. halophilus DSM 20339]WJS81024.1 tRNA pseudouridine(55) synthase TruB [Tetragenococcus halophilus]